MRTDSCMTLYSHKRPALVDRLATRARAGREGACGAGGGARARRQGLAQRGQRARGRAQGPARGAQPRRAARARAARPRADQAEGRRPHAAHGGAQGAARVGLGAPLCGAALRAAPRAALLGVPGGTASEASVVVLVLAKRAIARAHVCAAALHGCMHGCTVARTHGAGGARRQLVHQVLDTCAAQRRPRCACGPTCAHQALLRRSASGRRRSRARGHAC